MIPYIMCTKSNCPKANECYRFLAQTDEYQFYDSFVGLCNSEDNYRMLMKIKEGDKVRELNLIEIPEEIDKVNENEKIPENECLDIGIYEA